MRRPKTILVRLLLVGLSLVAADQLVRFTVLRDGLFLGRPLPPFGALPHPAHRAWAQELRGPEAPGIGRFDAELGWTWRPSSASDDGLFHVNALGARGERAYDPVPPPGVTRILTFGDSFTFCDEIRDNGAFQHIFENRHPDHEVLNFGVSGYGTDQALLRYRRLGRELGAEVVCIGLLLENIGRNVNRYRPLWNPSTGFCLAKPRFVLEGQELRLVPQPFPSRSALADALEGGTLLDSIAPDEHWYERPPVPFGRASAFLRLACGWQAHALRAPERLWQEPAGEPFRVTIALLETFQREALAAGARLAPVLLFPAKEDLAAYVDEDRVYWQALLDELERRQIDVLDLIPALAARERELRAAPEQGTLYFGGHLSSVGNAVVASELWRWLGERP